MSLLVDDHGALAKGDAQRAVLKAHLVLQCMTNSSVTVSDSSLINNRNLRDLLRDDETLRGLLADGLIKVALRDSLSLHENGLQRLLTSFEDRNAVNPAVAGLETTEIDFVQRNGTFRIWEGEKVAQNYADLCKKVLLSPRSARALGDTRHDLLARIITEEFGGEINRAQIYYDVEDLFARHGQPVTPDQLAHLRLCVDAPYHSNLPSLLGLDPAYDEAAKQSFELMRGVDLTATEIDTARELPDQLDAQHFVHGLAMLDVDDVHAFRDTFEFKAFIKAVVRRNNPDVIEECFFHLNVAVQNAILRKFPDLRRRSSIVSKRKITKKVHSFRTDGVSRVSDIVSIGTSLAGLAVPAAVGYCANLLVDYVRGHIEEPAARRSVEDTANHQMELARLSSYLKKKDMGGMITQSERIVETTSHEIETFVTNQ